MEALQALLRRHVGAAWRHRWLAVGFAWLFCCAGWAVTMTLPPEYEASARIYVDTDAVLTPLLRGIAIDNSLDSQINMLQQTLLSRPNLEKLISSTDLEMQIRGPADLERMVASLASRIKIHAAMPNLFTISYESPKPKLAYDVVQAILTIFIENKTGTSRRDMENAEVFLQQQIATYEHELQDIEQRRADFRSKYMDILPDANGGGSNLQAARQSVQSLQDQIDTEQAKREALAKELKITPQVLSQQARMIAGLGGHSGESPLAQAEQHLAELRLKYTDSYPGVIAAKQMVEALKSGKMPGGGYGASAGSGRPSIQEPPIANPVYQNLKLQMFQEDAMLNGLKRQLVSAVKQRDRLEAIARSAPGVQADYINLNRDYDIIRKNYDELLARREAMRIGAAADTKADKVKLRIIDPPQVPSVPVGPKRVLLLCAVLVLGLGGGCALAVLLVQFDRCFHTIEDLLDFGLPVAGAVSMVGGTGLRRHLVPAATLASAVLVLVAVFGGLLYKTLHTTGFV